MTLKAVPAIPEWMRLIAGNAGLSTKEVGAIYSLTGAGVCAASQRGDIPLPDWQNRCTNTQRTHIANYWYAKTIRKHVAKLRAAAGL